MSERERHTPGPWKYDPAEYKVWNDENGEHQLGEILCIANGNRQANMALAYVWDDPERFDAEGIHNARLIAAAPSLLEAAKAVLSLKDGGQNGFVPYIPTAFYLALRAAIALAEGAGA